MKKHKHTESWVESMDSFGHNLEFSFNGRTGTYKTKLGGFITILLNLLILQQAYYRLRQMILFENDSIQQNETKLQEIGPVSFKRMNYGIPIYGIKSGIYK